MKTLLFFMSPFVLEQKIVLIDDKDKDLIKQIKTYENKDTIKIKNFII